MSWVISIGVPARSSCAARPVDRTVCRCRAMWARHSAPISAMHGPQHPFARCSWRARPRREQFGPTWSATWRAGRAIGLGVPRVGAHRLRHALATELLRRGATLVEVGQILRHRDLATTAVYAKVDLGIASQRRAALAGSSTMSTLSQAAENYLALRRSLGHDLADAHRLLPRFVAYLDEHRRIDGHHRGRADLGPGARRGPFDERLAETDDRRPRLRPSHGRHRRWHPGAAPRADSEPPTMAPPIHLQPSGRACLDG